MEHEQKHTPGDKATEAILSMQPFKNRFPVLHQLKALGLDPSRWPELINTAIACNSHDALLEFVEGIAHNEWLMEDADAMRGLVIDARELLTKTIKKGRDHGN